MRRSARLLAMIAATCALAGCVTPVTGASQVRRPAPLAAAATPAPVVVNGLAVVILDEAWTRFRLDVFEEDHEEPAADCTFGAVFQIDPTTSQGLLKVTTMELVRLRGKAILKRDGDALPVFDKKRVAALAQEITAFSLEVGFPNGLSVTAHLRALLAGEPPPKPGPGAVRGRLPAGVALDLRAGR